MCAIRKTIQHRLAQSRVGDLGWPFGTNTLRKLGTEAPAVLDPVLQARDHTQLTWMPNNTQLIWARKQLTAPILTAARGQNGDFLVAKVFPMEGGASNHTAPPDQLWSVFEGRDDLVYYGWELTAMRVMQWRLLTEMFPIYPPPTHTQIEREQKAVNAAKSPQPGNGPLSPLAVTDTWLSELSNPFMDNTVTVVTRTSPTELTVVRTSPFLFTGLSWFLISHWLADAPMGPVDYRLLPQAKMTGPGVPRPH